MVIQSNGNLGQFLMFGYCILGEPTDESRIINECGELLGGSENIPIYSFVAISTYKYEWSRECGHEGLYEMGNRTTTYIYRGTRVILKFLYIWVVNETANTRSGSGGYVIATLQDSSATDIMV